VALGEVPTRRRFGSIGKKEKRLHAGGFKTPDEASKKEYIGDKKHGIRGSKVGHKESLYQAKTWGNRFKTENEGGGHGTKKTGKQKSVTRKGPQEWKRFEVGRLAWRERRLEAQPALSFLNGK